MRESSGMDEMTLKPCPRHGMAGEIRMYPGATGEIGAHVGCSLCTMEFPHPAQTKKEAAKRWNNAYCWNLRDAVIDAQKKQLDFCVQNHSEAGRSSRDAEVKELVGAVEHALKYLRSMTVCRCDYESNYIEPECGMRMDFEKALSKFPSSKVSENRAREIK